jgi:hypothetical protein
MESQIEFNVISARQFNDIPDLYDQVQFPNDPTMIDVLANLFYQHNVHERFGLHLLHRH